MNTQAPHFPAKYFGSYLELATRSNYTLLDLERECGIPLTKILAQRQMISAQDAKTILEGLYSLTGKPHLGLCVGANLKLASDELVLVAAITQASFSRSLKTVAELSDQLFPACSLAFIESSHQVKLRIRLLECLAPIKAFFFESVVSNIYLVMKYLMGDSAEPDYVAFPYAPPGYQEKYGEIFNCEVRFSAPYCEFAMSRSLAEKRLPYPCSAIPGTAKSEFRVIKQQANLKALQQEVRQIIAKAENGFPTMNEVAGQLNLSGRTFRRKLNLLGTTYMQELDSFRKEKAMSLLEGNELSIAQISRNLGFCDASAFSRIFRRWTGKSPSDYRKKSKLYWPLS